MSNFKGEDGAILKCGGTQCQCAVSARRFHVLHDIFVIGRGNLRWNYSNRQKCQKVLPRRYFEWCPIAIVPAGESFPIPSTTTISRHLTMALNFALELSFEQLISTLNKKLSMELASIRLKVPPAPRTSMVAMIAEVRSSELKTPSSFDEFFLG